MSTNINSALTQAGISAEQAILYQVLLEKGPQTANRLAKNTPIKRTYVYKLMEQLVEKGLVVAEIKRHTTIFNATSPDRLIDLVETKRLEVEQAAHAVEMVLPRLKSLHAASATKPVVTYYEGMEGLKRVFSDIYAKKDEPVWGCVDLEAARQAIMSHIPEHLIPLRIRNQVYAKSFIADSPDARKVAKNDVKSLRDSRLLNKDTHPLPAEIDVYEDKVAMLSFTKGRFVGIIIQNQEIATSLKSIFRLAFEKTSHHSGLDLP